MTRINAHSTTFGKWQSVDSTSLVLRIRFSVWRQSAGKCNLIHIHKILALSDRWNRHRLFFLPIVSAYRRVNKSECVREREEAKMYREATGVEFIADQKRWISKWLVGLKARGKSENVLLSLKTQIQRRNWVYCSFCASHWHPPLHTPVWWLWKHSCPSSILNVEVWCESVWHESI